MEFTQLNKIYHSQKNIIEKCVSTRAFEECILNEFSRGTVRGTVHTSVGQEYWITRLASFFRETDFVFGTHRSHAIYLALTGDFEGLASEILGKSSGSSKGIGGSQHLHKGNFYSNGIQGGMAPISVGAAYESNSNYGYISVVVLGDGTFGEGSVYEAMNLAAVLKSRTLFVVEDNQIAQSTPTANVLSHNIVEVFELFKIPFIELNEDFLISDFEIASFLEELRNGVGPRGIVLRVKRLSSHSKGDDNRDPKLISQYLENDLINLLLKHIPELESFHQEKLLNYENMIASFREIEDSKKIVENALDKKIHLIHFEPRKDIDLNFRQLTYNSLSKCLHQSNTMLVGEDIEFLADGTEKPYFGAFGVTRDLSEKFPLQVKNFPIAENSIVGFGIGRALSGKETICEIMFGDFITLAVDQIFQQASKIVTMYGTDIEIPILIRTPMGGRRGYGPTHSQNLEGLFSGLPNVLIYSWSIFSDELDYLKLLELKVPILAIENKDLYDEKAIIKISPAYEYNQRGPLRSIHLFNKVGAKSDFQIITYGHAVSITLDSLSELATNYEVFGDVFCLQILNPLKISEISNYLNDSLPLLLIEECDSKAGLGSALLVELMQESKFPRIYTLGANGIIGASKYSENCALLNKDMIINCVLDITGQEK